MTTYYNVTFDCADGSFVTDIREGTFQLVDDFIEDYPGYPITMAAFSVSAVMNAIELIKGHPFTKNRETLRALQFLDPTWTGELTMQAREVYDEYFDR